VCFQPYSNNICTSSGDKTVSLWDARSGLCIQTFYGHDNAVMNAAFCLQGDLVVSGDSDGVVKLWDIRMVQERQSINTVVDIVSNNTGGAVLAGELSRVPVNAVTFDVSGERVIVASDSGHVLTYGLDGTHLGSLIGHEKGAQSVVVDPKGSFVVSASADCSFRLWAQ
jgi:WD40 repeat protein